MSYDRFFTDALQRVREEQRYRIFADLERLTGLFPIRRKERVARGRRLGRG
jgi:hypothetical protein